MINQEDYRQKLKQIDGLVQKYAPGSELETRVGQLKDEMDRYAVKTLMVGRFSAGKSALLNAVLGRELLAESQLPETELAAELAYSDTEYIEAVSADGKATRLPVDAADLIEPDTCSHAVYHINSEFLKKLPDIILVDMPGFDSSIARHNKAILQYIGQAGAYVLVVDCEDGTLSQPTVDFLKEIRLYHSNLAIVLTKCDKKLPEDVAAVEAQVAEVAGAVFGGDIPVTTLSAFDPKAGERMLELLSKIDIQTVFEENFRPGLQELSTMLKSVISAVKKGMYYDSKQIADQLEQIEREIKEIAARSKTEQRKLHSRLFEEAYPNVLNDIKNALLSSSESLTEAAVSGPDAFQRRVNDIIRPIIVSSLNVNIQMSVTHFIESADFSLGETVDSGVVGEHMREVVEAISRFAHSGGGEEGAKNGVQKLLAVLAIATDFVAPWIEVIVVLLPDIISVLGKIGKKLRMEEFNQKIRNQVIPQIIRTLEPEMKGSFLNIESRIMEELTSRMNQHLQLQKETFTDLSGKSARERKEYEQRLADLDSDMRALCSLEEGLGL